jgi:GNAT superfamily N-acetyltransferase
MSRRSWTCRCARIASSAESRRDFFSDHPRFSLRDVRVGELDGEIVSSLVLYPLHTFVRGVKLSVTGIGSVAVSPEHRRRGVAEALVRATLREMRQRGDALSLLYAFRSNFYRRYGWGLIETTHMLSVPPTLLPASDEARRVRSSAPARSAAGAGAVRSLGHRTRSLRARASPRMVGTPPVGLRGRVARVRAGPRSDSRAISTCRWDSGEGPWKLVLTVNGFVAMTPDAHRGLTGHLHALRDQAVEVVMNVPVDAPWPAQLGDAANLRGELKLGSCAPPGIWVRAPCCACSM